MLLLLLLLILLLTPLLAYTIYKPPYLLIKLLQWYYTPVIFHLPLPSSQKIIALTLDDAPSPFTSDILDLLAAHRAKATFFIIGSQVSAHLDIIQRIRDEGHELGNHAWKDEPTISLPPSQLDRQVMEVEALLPSNAPLSISSEVYPNPPKYFRPGSGFFNKAMVRRIQQLGYRTVLGSVYPHDPQIHNAGINARHVLGRIRPGSVVIMHDRREYSIEQVRLVLEGLESKGWRATSVGGLLEAKAEVETKGY